MTSEDVRGGSGREQRIASVNEADEVWGRTAIGYCSVLCNTTLEKMTRWLRGGR